MSQRRKLARQEAAAAELARKRRRGMFLIAMPLAVGAIALAFFLSGQPGYSSFDVIGKKPAVVQVFLPG